MGNSELDTLSDNEVRVICNCNKTGCRSCRNRKQKAYRYAQNRVETLAKVRAYGEGPGRKMIMCAKAKVRAKKKDLPFSITTDDFDIPATCPILGIKLVMNKGAVGPDSATLDRKVPALGYVPGNVWVISKRANDMKSDATPEEIRRFARWALVTRF